MKIRDWIGQLLLNKKLSQKPLRKVHFSGVQNMHSIGVLFDATYFDNYKTVLAFEKRLRQMGAKTIVLGYQDTKKPTENYIDNLHTGFISRKDFNWFNNCNNAFVTEFTKMEFDALFVVTTQRYFPIHYASQLSSAKFKIGLVGENQSDFDLMLDIPISTPFQDQLTHMWTYLEMLSAPTMEMASAK
jgi:hypothetical protein